MQDPSFLSDRYAEPRVVEERVRGIVVGVERRRGREGGALPHVRARRVLREPVEVGEQPQFAIGRVLRPSVVRVAAGERRAVVLESVALDIRAEA